MTDQIKRDDALNACVLREDNPPTEMQLSLRNVISALPAIDPTDRIEQTEAKLATCEKYRDAYAECDRIGAQAVRDLEAKLAKAVEALDMLVRDCEADYPPSHGAIKHFAIATLAEIKGESQDGMV